MYKEYNILRCYPSKLINGPLLNLKPLALLVRHHGLVLETFIHMR